MSLDELFSTSTAKGTPALSDMFGLKGSKAVAPEFRVAWGQPGPKGSEDLDRVAALPRRAPVWPGLAPRVSDRLRRAGSSASLREHQAAALYEAAKINGLLGLMGVGSGKGLLSLLLPVVMRSTRAVLLVPPQLKDQTFSSVYPQWAREFRLPTLAGANLSLPNSYPGIIYVVAYSELSSAKRGDVLTRYNPDLIIADEAHALKAFTAARTKRFLRYFDKDSPTARLCALSGTLTTKSIKDFWHLAKYALRQGSPLPLEEAVVSTWAPSLDAGDFAAAPGDLVVFCQPGETARQGFRRRLIETPGVVATEQSGFGGSLVLTKRNLELPEEVKEALKEMRETATRPDGEEFDSPLLVADSLRQLACGFHYYWDWPRGEPEEVRERWKAARAAWNKEVRIFLETKAAERLDSPDLLAQAAARYLKWGAAESVEVRAAILESGPIWAAQNYSEWMAVKHTAKPETKTAWISDFMVRDAAEWAKQPGIIWYEHKAIGHAIARATGLPLYGSTSEMINLNPTPRMLAEKEKRVREGRWMGDTAGQWIDIEQGERSIVASISAHGTGKNLQYAFSRNLITTPPTDGAVWEQLLGRTHREGQAADTVEVDLYLPTPEFRRAMETAFKRADYLQTMQGAQKLLLAQVLFDVRA